MTTTQDRSTALKGQRIAFLVANEGVEQVELTEPWDAVKAAGAEPVLLAPDKDTVQAFNHLDKADTFQADAAIASSQPDDFDGIVLPGGVSNPDQLRMNADAVTFIQKFVAGGKPVGVICHGSWTLVEAGVVEGRTFTSWPSLRTDLTNAGATWVDEEVVVDGQFISSRNPDDLPAFCTALVEQLDR